MLSFRSGFLCECVSVCVCKKEAGILLCGNIHAMLASLFAAYQILTAFLSLFLFTPFPLILLLIHRVILSNNMRASIVDPLPILAATLLPTCTHLQPPYPSVVFRLIIVDTMSKHSLAVPTTYPQSLSVDIVVLLSAITSESLGTTGIRSESITVCTITSRMISTVASELAYSMLWYHCPSLPTPPSCTTPLET